MRDNRSILEKADLALADLTTGGGILLPAQAQKFLRLLIKQSVLLQYATVTPMAAPKQQINKIKFGSRVLRPGKEATPLPDAQRVAPDLSHVELDAKLYKAEIHLDDEVLEDNIERGDLRQTIMELLAEAISRDMEDVVINGDTSSTDPLLSTMDGLLKQAKSHVVDAAAAPIGKNLLRDMVKTMPSEYLRDKSTLRYLTSVDSDLNYRAALAERPTPGGDKFLETDAAVYYSGVALQPIPLFPDTLGQAGNQTVLLLLNPKNIQVGIWRQIRIETWRDISAGVLKVVATLRCDATYAEEPAVVKAINLAA